MKRRLSLLLAVVLAMALVSIAAAQQDPSPSAPNPLVQLLQSKGVITAQEAAAINQATTPAEQQARLSQLLLSKGVISQEEYDHTVTTGMVSNPASGNLIPAVARVSAGASEPSAAASAPQKPAAPPIIPAVAPIRVLQLEPAKAGGLVPDLKLGSGAKLKFYGFLKSTAVYDTSSQQGNDFPLPGFLGDTGPSGSPEFHLKARAARAGANFEWPDISKDTALTGRLEFDFEGNFTRTNNRNISSVRSSQPSIRLAWMRIDHKVSDNTSIFALFGQDWTPFASSTLPNLLETTGLGISYGSLYTREPQFRFGLYHNFGGSRNFTVGIEPAFVFPAFGFLPLNVADQLGFGERQGADSARPQVEGRLVFQFQLDKAKGVAPAQIIFSGMHGNRRAIVLAAAVPAAFKSAFPNGATLNSDRYGFTGEIQIPTRYMTVIAKYWAGEDLRWYFSGELFTPFNDARAGFFADPALETPCTATGGGCPSAASIDGSSTVLFGFNSDGIAQVIPQNPVRAVGGFAQVSFPLSRIFNADPTGRNAGWTLAFTYGIDQAKARDVRFFSPAGARNKSDMGVATLTYKMNSYVTFGYESSLYRTRSTCTAANQIASSPSGASCPGTLFRGLGAREVHDWRNEFGPIFTF